MRKSKFDAWVVMACVVVTVYSFFWGEWSVLFESDQVFWFLLDDGVDRVVQVSMPTAAWFAPLVCVVFLCFGVFWRELLPVNRRWVLRQVRGAFQRGKAYLCDGIQEYRVWKKCGKK